MSPTKALHFTYMPALRSPSGGRMVWLSHSFRAHQEEAAGVLALHAIAQGIKVQPPHMHAPKGLPEQAKPLEILEATSREGR